MSGQLGDARFLDGVSRCIGCGLCLPACPTYELDRTEMEGPRGRLALMKAAAEGRLPLTAGFARHIDHCLGCLSCETACPSGVEYGGLLDVARQGLAEARPAGRLEALARRLALRYALSSARGLAAIAWLVRIAQRTGVVALFARLPGVAGQMARLLPPPTAHHGRRAEPLPAIGPERGTAALFQGCVQQSFLGGINEATASVLRRNGFRVVFPSGQTCCGAAAHHMGEVEWARQVARRNLEAFDLESVDVIVNNAGGCGAELKGYDGLFEPGSEEAGKAARFAAKVRDVCELLADGLAVRPLGRLDLRVAYADSCHLRHGQGVVAEPRELLAAIPGLQLVELERPDTCCGSAGVYNLAHPTTANELREQKLVDVQATGASVVATTNPGCHLHLEAGARESGRPLEVVHVVELLERSYAAS